MALIERTDNEVLELLEQVLRFYDVPHVALEFGVD